MARRQSRLSRRIESRTKKNLFLSLLGIILIFFILIKLGIPLLINFSLFIADRKDDSTQSLDSESSFIAPPILNPLPVATNSAQVVISGIANKGQTVRIYVNDAIADETEVKADGTFSTTIDVEKGLNLIKSKSKIKDKESKFSESVEIAYIDTKPTLDVTSPSDGQTFSKDQNTAPVSGKTSSGARITVNDFWAIVNDENNFSYTLPLKSGENEIKIIATDDAGNTTERILKVTYNP